MAEDILLTNLRFSGYILSATIIPLATIILGRKLIKDKSMTGTFNRVKLITFSIFACFSIMSILELIVEMNWFPLLSEIFGYNVNTVNLYSILIGTMVSLGLTLVFYANRWEMLYYSALMFFGGMVIFYYLTGFDAWLENYIYLAGAISLIFMYFTSFRIKDNGALGLAIFYTLVFSVLILGLPYFTQIIILAYNIFLLVFSFGLFKPFKQEVAE
jgi:hypothetical protein